MRSKPGELGSDCLKPSQAKNMKIAQTHIGVCVMIWWNIGRLLLEMAGALCMKSRTVPSIPMPSNTDATKPLKSSVKPPFGSANAKLKALALARKTPWCLPAMAVQPGHIQDARTQQAQGSIPAPAHQPGGMKNPAIALGPGLH